MTIKKLYLTLYLGAEFCSTLYMRHILWRCLIRCVNMKWIRRVLLKIESRHDSVHSRTARQPHKVKPVYPAFNFFEAGGIIIMANNGRLDTLSQQQTISSTASSHKAQFQHYSLRTSIRTKHDLFHNVTGFISAWRMVMIVKIVVLSIKPRSRSRLTKYTVKKIGLCNHHWACWWPSN